MKMFRLFPVLFAAWLVAPGLNAADPSGFPDVAWSPVQVTLVPDQLSVVSPGTPVIGVNFEPFWGGQKQVDVLSLQLLYGVSEQVQGVSVQGIGRTERFAGLQFGLVNLLTRFQGVSFSLVSGMWENRGLQAGLVNLSGDALPDFCGCKGVSRGGGMQLGIVNGATGGFQLGLLNYNENSPVPWMVLFNASAR